MSRSGVGELEARGEPVPPGVLLDGEGNPTDDPRAFIGPPRGVILPFGGTKGFALNMIAEVLGGILSGNGLGREWLDRGAAAINGLWLEAIDVREFQELDAFHAKVQELRSFVHSRKPAPGFDEVRLPGERSRRVAAERRKLRRKFGSRRGTRISARTCHRMTLLSVHSANDRTENRTGLALGRAPPTINRRHGFTTFAGWEADTASRFLRSYERVQVPRVDLSGPARTMRDQPPPGSAVSGNVPHSSVGQSRVRRPRGANFHAVR